MKKKNENDLANIVTEEVHNTLLLQWIVQLMIGFWTQKSCFIPLHQEIIQNYFASDFGRVFVVNGEALDVVSMRDTHIYMCDYEKQSNLFALFSKMDS